MLRDLDDHPCGGIAQLKKLGGVPANICDHSSAKRKLHANLVPYRDVPVVVTSRVAILRCTADGDLRRV
jgi:hypothetical protein